MKLEVRGGTFGYRSKKIIEGFDLEAPENGVLTILGPNGAGKTTLLKCIMGFLRWSKGHTLIDDRPLESYPSTQIWQHMSYVPQAKASPFSYSLLDTVVMGLNAGSGVFSTPSREDYNKATAMLERFGIADIAHRGCNEVSGGQLQMALIARALVSNPKILVLDEPESNLDMANQLKVLAAIESIAAEKTTTCIVNTHFPEHALMISDQTLFLGRDGKRLLGPSSQVVNEENIDAFYGVRAKVIPVACERGSLRSVFPYALSHQHGAIASSAGLCAPC